MAKDLRAWRAVTRDAIKITMTKTDDTKESVITITDGTNYVSAWLDSSGNIESISRY